MNNEKLWTKDFITASVINFLIFLIFYLLMVTIASYAVNEFHTSAAIAGLVSGIFIIGSLFGRLGTGRIIDNVGNKKILIVSVLFFAITSALYLMTNTLLFLILIRLLQGIAFGISTTAIGTIIAQIIPSSRKGEGISYYSMSTIISTAIGPFIGILLMEYGNFNTIFIFNLILAIFCLFISFTVSEPTRVLSKMDKIKGERSFKISNFLEYKAIPISIIVLITGFAYSSVLTFISLYTEQIHLVEAASVFFIVYAIIVLVSRPISGRLFDVKGANTIVYPCLFIFAIGMFLFSQANMAITLLLAGALFGLGYGNFISVSQAIAIKLAPPDKLGLATATYFIFYDLGFGVGPYLFGLFISFTGYRGLYSIMSVMIIVTIILYYFLHAKTTEIIIFRDLF